MQPKLGPSHTHLDVPLQVLLERRLLDSLPQLVVNLQLCRQPLYLPLQVRRRITSLALTHLPTVSCSRVPALCVTFRASSAAWNFSVSSVCSCCRLLCSSADKQTRSGCDAKCLRQADWFSRNTPFSSSTCCDLLRSSRAPLQQLYSSVRAARSGRLSSPFSPGKSRQVTSGSKRREISTTRL